MKELMIRYTKPVKENPTGFEKVTQSIEIPDVYFNLLIMEIEYGDNDRIITWTYRREE